ncbi:MAG: hypothetical protein FWC60_11300 [Firmicutes bacterium]|nr:hypothetical protein [Bacillota bacterium]
MEIKVYAGEGKYRVDLNVYCTGGSGLSGFLFGGTLPHVGGVALVAPAVELHGKKLSSCDEWTLTVPGHKDSYAANAVAKKICLAVNEAVSICCGIHIDDAGGEEIKILLANCLKAAELFIEQYLNK